MSRRRGFVVTSAAVAVVVVVVIAVLWLPRHLVLLLESSPGVGEPGGHLCQRHFGDDGQHDLLAFRRVRVLLVLRQPGLERRRRLAGGVLSAGGQIVASAVPIIIIHKTFQSIEIGRALDCVDGLL